ncbi:MAG: peptidoglycan recognition protein family protein [Armatimonadota bacterium]
MIKPIVFRLYKPARPADWPLGIVVHHSDTPFRIKGEFVDAKMLDRFHAQRGFSKLYKGKLYHIAYHYVILPDGTVQHGRPDKCAGAHSGKAFYNKHYLGVCLIGSFDPSSPFFGKSSATQPTAAQMTALQSLCVQLIRKYEIPVENVIRHRDTNSTYCPGRYMPFGHFMLALRKELVIEHITGDTGIYTSILPNMRHSDQSKEGNRHTGSENYHVVKNVGKSLQAVTCQEDN